MLSGKLSGWNWFRKRETSVEDNIERDCTLRVFLNDSRCELAVCDKLDVPAGRIERLFSGTQTSPEAMLSAAVDMLAPELAARIGNVEIFVDDEEISVVDSRQAKLSHFEGRALAEFGKYQLGGKPVCFASHRFGETSAQEAEKRIVAYISEDRLTAVLFALGRLARYTTFFGPWSLQSLLAEQSDDTQAKLSVHGRYSSLAITSAAAGAIAVRNFPIGSASLVNAYSKEYGISTEDAESALKSRPRIGTGKADAPTGSQLALLPMLNGLGEEVGATADYFEFQRLAGRAGSLQLSLLGARIAGFASWLTGMLSIDVSETAAVRPPKPVLNLLEGMRGGLLKLGNQHFDFVGGRFVRSANVGASGGSDEQGLVSRFKKASKQSLTLNDLKPAARPAAAVAAALVAIMGTYSYLLAPTDADLDATVRLYEGVLAQTARPAAQAADAPTTEPVLWAKDLVAISASLPYDVKLKQMVLLPASGSNGATLQISGLLPRAGQDNLQLIGRFISKLSASPKLRHRLGDISFAGVGQGTTDENPESQFSIVAKIAEGPKP
jgi:hypothetical protein